MTSLSPDTSLGMLVTENMARARILDAYDIAYYNLGDRTLEQACVLRGIPTDVVLQALARAEEPTRVLIPDWTRASTAYLITHIIGTHHRFLRQTLPYIASLMEKLEGAHGGNHPELTEMIQAFRHFKTVIEADMRHEEGLLFTRALSEQPEALEVLNATIEEHRVGHDEAMATMRSIREMTGGYQPPEDACRTHRDVLAKLAELEADLHIHLHKENNLLFPRLLEDAGAERV